MNKNKAGRFGLALLSVFWLCSGGRAPAAPSLALAGDVNLGRAVSRAAPLSALKKALKADAVYANLESPLTDAPSQTRGVELRADPALVSNLPPFTHLGTENNHTLDGGAAGRLQTRRTLLKAGLVPVDRSPTLTLIGGVKVAWLAFFDDGHTPPPLKAIRSAAQQTAYVVVGVHWGAEYNPVTERQRLLAGELAEAGAALIVGSGPHVLQGHEFIGRTLVLYSLGNLLFDQAFPSARIGAVVRLRLDDLHAACAVPTRYRAGHSELASGKQAALALSRLGLPQCTW